MGHRRIDVVARGRLAGFDLRHEPPRLAVAPTLAGHIHPVVRLRDGKRDSMRLPVYWLSGQRLVLPAFGSFTGGQLIRADPHDRLFVTHGDGVVELAGHLFG